MDECAERDERGGHDVVDEVGAHDAGVRRDPRNVVQARVTRSREAILAAARELLRAAGPAALTHQSVAARAAVGRTTVYRHWPRPDQLLSDAMAGVEMPFFLDPTTPVRPWLVRQLRALADQMALPDG